MALLTSGKASGLGNLESRIADLATRSRTNVDLGVHGLPDLGGVEPCGALRHRGASGLDACGAGLGLDQFSLASLELVEGDRQTSIVVGGDVLDCGKRGDLVAQCINRRTQFIELHVCSLQVVQDRCGPAL